MAVFTFSICTVGQDTARHDLFRNGVYLENLNITIPWYADFNKINNYGNPRVITKSDKGHLVFWDSVKVLNGISVTFRYVHSKLHSKKGGYNPLTTLWGTINVKDFERVKDYLNDTPNSHQTSFKDYKSETSYYWTINNCRVRLIRMKTRRHYNECSFDIQKKI